MASVRRCQKLPPCQTEPVPASSKMDPPLAKAETISNGGSASVITYLRKGKNCCATAAGREEQEKCERNNHADTKVSEEGGGGGGPGARAEIPLQPMVKTIVRQVVPLQPMEVHSGADIHPAAHGGPHKGAGVCALKEAVTPWRLCAGAGSWQELRPRREEQSVPEGLYPMERTHAGAVHEEL
ncbi:epimerase family protein SDR39U1 [Grus japonensis]|uniref:Epimerase family protein SDR39U1 n=1 Tax=Grus japonensis TaxID=30415 RepID=A0ABC9YCN1_GRUJA